MTYSDALVDFIKAWEGRKGKPALTAYDDGGGVLTIGYGCTQDVKAGDTCTQEQAESWLRNDIDATWDGIDPHIHVTLAQHELDACISLAFNIGVGAFVTSTLLSRLNNSDFASAADQFLRWNRDGGKIIPGLTKRRNAERAMFIDADYSGRP